MSSNAEYLNALLRLKAKNERDRIEFLRLPLYQKLWRITKDRVYMSYLYLFDYDRYIKYKRLGDIVNEINNRNLTMNK